MRLKQTTNVIQVSNERAMSRISMILFVVVLLLLSPYLFVIYIISNSAPDVPTIQETWWTDEDPAKEDRKIHPFQINISKEVLDDLKYRLNHTRPLPKPLLDNQIYGFNGDLAQEILDYWRTEYNWKERELKLNKYPHFITSIQGLKIHFIHIKPSNVSTNIKIIPLLITHGWPSSFVEFLEVIQILSTTRKNRDFVFEVVLATIPGFGFSDPAQKPGFGSLEAALVFKNLMNRLGHGKFYVHSGDMGMLIMKAMATSLKDSVLGFHSNMCISLHPFSLIKYALGSIYPQWIKRDTHRELIYPIWNLLNITLMEFGYLHLQTTKPDTYGIAIDDTPIGMAVQYLEKFITAASIHNRSKKDGGLKEIYDLDVLLDNIMTYWVTKTATTSYRFYSESFTGFNAASLIWLPIMVPTACADGPYDLVSPDGLRDELFPNTVQSTDHGLGHFFAYENPEFVAEDIYEAVQKMMRINDKNMFMEKSDL